MLLCNKQLCLMKNCTLESARRKYKSFRIEIKLLSQIKKTFKIQQNDSNYS